MSLVEIVAFDFETKFDRAQIFEVLQSMDANPDELVDRETKQFLVTTLTGVNYAEFAKFPDGEPILRVRVVPPQIWVENREELPIYIHEALKEDWIPHRVYKSRRIDVEQLASKNPEPLNLSPSEIQCEYKG